MNNFNSLIKDFFRVFNFNQSNIFYYIYVTKNPSEYKNINESSTIKVSFVFFLQNFHTRSTKRKTVDE